MDFAQWWSVWVFCCSREGESSVGTMGLGDWVGEGRDCDFTVVFSEISQDFSSTTAGKGEERIAGYIQDLCLRGPDVRRLTWRFCTSFFHCRIDLLSLVRPSARFQRMFWIWWCGSTALSSFPPAEFKNFLKIFPAFKFCAAGASRLIREQNKTKRKKPN